jgi:transcriptional regulator with XRE-family HTH domain
MFTEVFFYITLLNMNGMDYRQLGERIKEERIKRHKTQDNMAEALNISTSYIGQIERGERHLTLDTLILIANYFKVSVDYLIRDSLELQLLDSTDEWKLITEGKTVEQKQILFEALKAINNLLKMK